MKASFIIGFIAVSAAVLTFAAFAPMQQATQVRRLLTATTTNATPVCNISTNATLAQAAFISYQCNQTETDSDGATPPVITFKYYFVNISIDYNYTVNTTATVNATLTAPAYNTTTYLNYVDQLFTQFSNSTVAGVVNANVTTNNTIQVQNITIVSYNSSNVTAAQSANASLQNQTVINSQNQTYINFNFTTTFNVSNSSAANVTANYSQITNQQTNSTNTTNTTVQYNQSSTSTFSVTVPTIVITNTFQVANYTSNNLTFNGTQLTNVSTQINYQVNQTLIQNQTLCFNTQNINLTNMSLSTNFTNCTTTQIVCVYNSSSLTVQLAAAAQFTLLNMNPNPFPTIVPGQLGVNLTLNVAVANPLQQAFCNITGVYILNSTVQPFNSAQTPQGVKQAAKTVLYCSLFQTRQTYAQGNLTLLACPSTNQNFKCKKAANFLIIQKSWVKHWCTNQNSCVGGASSPFNLQVAALLQARMTACAKGANRSQKVCNGAYVKYNAALKNQRDVCAPF